MALGRQMHDRVRLLETQDVRYRRAVANVDLIERVVRAFLDRFQGCEVSRIRQAVDIDDADAELLDEHAANG